MKKSVFIHVPFSVYFSVNIHETTFCLTKCCEKPFILDDLSSSLQIAHQLPIHTYMAFVSGKETQKKPGIVMSPSLSINLTSVSLSQEEI